MIFLSDIAEFARTKGSRDKKKRLKRAAISLGSLAAGAGAGYLAGKKFNKKALGTALGAGSASAARYAVLRKDPDVIRENAQVKKDINKLSKLYEKTGNINQAIDLYNKKEKRKK